MVANQAVMLFKQMKLGAAAHLADKLPDTPEYHDIKMFTDLETLFFKADKTPEEEQRAQRALQYAMQTSPENQAILCFELAPELGYSYQEVERRVDSLSDYSAKKWYIKAMIAANTATSSEDQFMELVNRYGVDEALRMQENQIPVFLAYLQRAFDIDPTMLRKLYTSDVHISDELRNKYPYDPKKADAYRQLFKQIVKE
jgi:TPR repeat protein